jgi:uncharacterized OsmC-like protein
MEVFVQYLSGVQFEAIARGHGLITDQPLDKGGQDAGMTPPELLLASLGTCAGHYAAEYLRARGLPAEGLQVRVTAEKAAVPTRLDKFRVQVEVPNLEDPRHQEGVLRSVKRCLIHNTMEASLSVEIAWGAGLSRPAAA